MTSLHVRMEDIVNSYNNAYFEEYKPYVISIKSKEILEYINAIQDSFEEKIQRFSDYNKILTSVSKECYRRFNPNVIYSFNDEIHLVFVDSLDFPYLYNNNINKIITTIVSVITRQFTKEFLSVNIDFNFTCSGKYAIFKHEFEVLNYLIWRQNDCKRNNTFTLYKYFDENLHGKSLQYMSKALSFYLSKLELSFDLRKIIYGNILKKEIIYVENKDKELSIKKIVTTDHDILSLNFDENLQKLIYNRYL
jgi:hypothetical protein